MAIGSAMLPLLRRHASSAELSVHAAAPPSDTSPQKPSSLNSLQTSPIDLAGPENKSFNSPSTFRIRRKVNPAIAARFKQLGFGGDKHNTANDTSTIGRIPEDHISRLDSLHRANSNPTPFIHKLGRTWSFATGHSTTNSPSATPPSQPQSFETPSTRTTSLTSQTPQIVGSSSTGFTVIESTIARTNALNAAIAAEPIVESLNSDIGYNYAAAELAIIASAPRVEVTDMSTYLVHAVDAQKYRLPAEHVNGDGTKAMPATNIQHLGREADELPPPPPPPKDEPKQEQPQSKPQTSEGLKQTQSRPQSRPLSRPQSKEAEGLPADYSNDVDSYFNPFGRERAGSIYTLSRVSFVNQLAQLTSLQLPDAGSLATRVAAIPTSRAAAKALTSAAEQIRSWISKAFEVLEGLDADDDVEWAAAGGREGLEDVDKAIARFDELINVYVTAIEGLQRRDDIAETPTDDLTTVVRQVENILNEWRRIKHTLQAIKGQVGVAIEWEELWNVVLGDIGAEMDILCRLVYEMEEKRHKSLIEATDDGVEPQDLETIVEETPPAKPKAANRFSITSSFPTASQAEPASTQAADDSSLLALFARMQPLRASLDFLPMRLSAFHQRAEDIFPTACEELEARRDRLEENWKVLDKDAESLRQELGEDRWVLVFRSAGRQASKMYESVGRSLQKLSEAIDAGQQHQNWAAVGQKIENYESKKIHYGPSIERVLSIIEKGVQDRLTINGEIVRLHSDMQKRWEDLKEEMYELDQRVQALHIERQSQQLRDSVSSLVSNDRSTSFSSANQTPGSSPASSVIMSNFTHGTDPNTPGKMGARRTPGSAVSRKGISAKSSGYGQQSYAPPPMPRNTSTTPTGNRIGAPRPALPAANPSLISRPRWNTSVKTNDGTLDLKYKPLPAQAPLNPPPPAVSRSFSEHSRTPSGSRIPLRKSIGGGDLPLSPLADVAASTNGATLASLNHRPKAKQNMSFRDRMSASPGPYGQHVLLSPPRQLQARTSHGNLAAAAPTARRQSIQPGQLFTPQPPERMKTANRRASVQPLGGFAAIPQAQGAPPNRATVGRSASSGVGGAQLEQGVLGRPAVAGRAVSVTSSLGHRAPTASSRAGSAMGMPNRRASLLPQPRGVQEMERGRREGSLMGREGRVRERGRGSSKGAGQESQGRKVRGEQDVALGAVVES